MAIGFGSDLACRVVLGWRFHPVPNKAGFSPSHDTLYSTGDIADRGPKILETIRFLYEMGDVYKPILGNHDVWLQNYLYDGRVPLHWLRNGGEETISSIEGGKVSQKEKDALCQWLRNAPYCCVLEDAVIVHGGLVSELHSLSTLEALEKKTRTLPEELGDIGLKRTDREAQEVVRLIWDRTLLRDIALAEDGKGDFPQMPDIGGRLLIVGHTPLINPYYSRTQKLLCVDSGSCYKGGCLTLYSLDDHVYWRSDRDGAIALDSNGSYEEHP